MGGLFTLPPRGRAKRGPFGRPRWMGGRKIFFRMNGLRRIFPVHVCLFPCRLPPLYSVKMQQSLVGSSHLFPSPPGKKKSSKKEQPLLRLPRWSPTLVLVLRTKCISAEAMQDVAAQLGVQAADKAQGEGRNMHLSAPARPRAPPPNVRGAARAHPRRRQRDHHPLRAAGAGGAGGRRGRGAGSGE